MESANAGWPRNASCELGLPRDATIPRHGRAPVGRRLWSPEVWDRYPERLAQTGGADVRNLLKDCAGREIITVAGDAAALGPQLASLGGGPQR
jgi:hypothetical protein